MRGPQAINLAGNAVLIFEPAATRDTGNVQRATFTVPIGVKI